MPARAVRHRGVAGRAVGRGARRAAGRRDDDFFASGGSSLAAAQLVSLIRQTYPGVSVADVYHHPTLRALAARLDEVGSREAATRTVAPVPAQAGVDQTMLMVLLLGLVGLRWVVVAGGAQQRSRLVGEHPWAPTVSWWWVLAGWAGAVQPAGPDRDLGRRRPAAAARRAPRQLPARRRRPHATVDGREAGRC